MDDYTMSEKKMLEVVRAGRAQEPAQPVVTEETLGRWMELLKKYKSGKNSLERRVIAAENWWKLHNDIEEASETAHGWSRDFKSKSARLHNVIVSKHADAIEAYPEANILPREKGDVDEARMLTAIVPCILERNRFEGCYSDNIWQKLKTGTAVYRVTWDQDKLNGLGDIKIDRVNLLNIFWEPGITNIQDSKHLFCTYLADREEMESMYPDAAERLKSKSFEASKFLYDDHVDTADMVTVIEHYYHRYQNGKRVLHYAKFAEDVLLESTENKGMPIYDHGRYPFVMDTLFPIEGSPAGYGYIDIGNNSQMQIDLLRTAILKNAMVGATPRFFSRQDGAINEEEFLDLTKPIVHVTGPLDETSVKAIDFTGLSGNYIDYLADVINELRQVTGNTETATGSGTSGATAASAIAALQEASGKGSRDSSKSSYRAFSEIVELVIELVRQFYNEPRKFRIAGEMGADTFATYDNSGIKPQKEIGLDGQEDVRLPVFDLKVEPQKRNAYTRLSQNELALQFYNAGFFAPQNADSALTALGMMEFEGKDEIMRKISANGTMAQQLQKTRQMLLAMANEFRPDLAAGLAQSFGMEAAQAPTAAAAPVGEMPGSEPKENSLMMKARQRSAEASQPQG